MCTNKLFIIGLSISNSKKKKNSPDLGTLLPLVFPVIRQKIMTKPASIIYQTLNPISTCLELSDVAHVSIDNF